MSTIILTGAAGDIGGATVHALAAQGHTVIGVVRSAAPPAVAGLLAQTVVADLGDRASIESLAAALPQRFDWLVTAHGYIDPSSDPLQVPAASVEKTFAVNAVSQIHLIQLLAARLARGMILVSSSAGLAANGRFAAYSASKAAVNSIAQGFARNLPHLTFVSVCPGPTAGRMRERINAPAGQSPVAVAALIADIVAGAADCVSGDVVLVRDGERSIVSRIA
jgi:3-oxoacyl-[acyl-carrier protein] reductase